VQKKVEKGEEVLLSQGSFGGMRSRVMTKLGTEIIIQEVNVNSRYLKAKRGGRVGEKKMKVGGASIGHPGI